MGPGAFTIPEDDEPEETASAFAKAIAEAHHGDTILLYSGPWEDWNIALGGIDIIKDGGRRLRNGVVPCIARDEDDPPFLEDTSWEANVPHEDDEAQCDSWKPHPYGIVFQTGNRFELLVLHWFDADEIIC